MSLNEKYPQAFQPFERLIVCSNELLNGRAIVEIKGNPFLLLGKGVSPKVWLAMPEYIEGSIDLIWVFAINANQTSQKQFNVVENDNQTSIAFEGVPILEAVKITENECVVNYLDLRPVGLLIYGNADGLHAGNDLLKKNIFSGQNSMVAINGRAVIGYNVYVSKDPSIPLKHWTRVNDKPVPTTSFTMRELSPDTQYFAYVTAISAA
ncbi:MAG: fibronectin type III domain-containing protein, partial [Pyrinomonadaceae bacterium]